MVVLSCSTQIPRKPFEVHVLYKPRRKSVRVQLHPHRRTELCKVAFRLLAGHYRTMTTKVIDGRQVQPIDGGTELRGRYIQSDESQLKETRTNGWCLRDEKIYPPTCGKASGRGPSSNHWNARRSSRSQPSREMCRCGAIHQANLSTPRQKYRSAEADSRVIKTKLWRGVDLNYLKCDTAATAGTLTCGRYIHCSRYWTGGVV